MKKQRRKQNKYSRLDKETTLTDLTNYNFNNKEKKKSKTDWKTMLDNVMRIETISCNRIKINKCNKLMRPRI